MKLVLVYNLLITAGLLRYLYQSNWNCAFWHDIFKLGKDGVVVYVKLFWLGIPSITVKKSVHHAVNHPSWDFQLGSFVKDFQIPNVGHRLGI